MSDSVQSGSFIKKDQSPRAMVHKKILDTAESNPDFSIKKIAEQTGGATIQLVDRVLNEYGDPANNEIESGSKAETAKVSDQNIGQESNNNVTRSNKQTMETDKSSSTVVSSAIKNDGSGDSEKGEETSPKSTSGVVEQDGTEISDKNNPSSTTAGQSTDGQSSEKSGNNMQSKPSKSSHSSGDKTGKQSAGIGDSQYIRDGSELSKKQLDVLRSIRDRPHATQAEIADELNVSRATISRRVNAIDGFEWGNRLEFVDMMFDESEQRSNTNDKKTPNEELLRRLASIEDRIETIEEIIDVDPDSQESTFDDPELATTVIRACIDSEIVTEEQEKQIIHSLVQNE